MNKEALNNLQELLSQLKHNFNGYLTEILENMDITDNAFEDIIDLAENLEETHEFVTDELTEILADLDAKISPEENLEAYETMHNRVLEVQKTLLKGTEYNP